MVIPQVPFEDQAADQDKAIDAPFMAQKQTLEIQTLQRTTETPQRQNKDQVVVVPDVQAFRVPQVQLVEKWRKSATSLKRRPHMPVTRRQQRPSLKTAAACARQGFAGNDVSFHSCQAQDACHHGRHGPGDSYASDETLSCARLVLRAMMLIARFFPSPGRISDGIDHSSARNETHKRPSSTPAAACASIVLLATMLMVLSLRLLPGLKGQTSWTACHSRSWRRPLNLHSCRSLDSPAVPGIQTSEWLEAAEIATLLPEESAPFVTSLVLEAPLGVVDNV